MTLQLIYAMTTGLDEEIYYLHKNDKPYFSMDFSYATKLTIDRKNKTVFINNLFLHTEYEKLIARLMFNLILETKEALEIEGYTMIDDYFTEIHGSDMI